MGPPAPGRALVLLIRRAMTTTATQAAALPSPNPWGWLARAATVGAGAGLLPVVPLAFGLGGAEPARAVVTAWCALSVVVAMAAVGVVPLFWRACTAHGLMLRVMGGSMLRFFGCIVAVVGLQLAAGPMVVAFMLGSFLAWVSMTAADALAFGRACRAHESTAGAGPPRSERSSHT